MIFPPRATASAQPGEPDLVKSANTSSAALANFSCALTTPLAARTSANPISAKKVRLPLAMCAAPGSNARESIHSSLPAQSLSAWPAPLLNFVAVLTAITRAVSPALAACELSFLPRQPIDVAIAQQQHHRYEKLLAKLGARVLSLPAEPALPDSTFVEDP